MATQTKTTTGNNITTYVITDAEGSTVTVVLTDSFGAGRTTTFASSGGLHQDGQQTLTTLMQLLSTGLTP